MIPRRRTAPRVCLLYAGECNPPFERGNRARVLLAENAHGLGSCARLRAHEHDFTCVALSDRQFPSAQCTAKRNATSAASRRRELLARRNRDLHLEPPGCGISGYQARPQLKVKVPEGKLPPWRRSRSDSGVSLGALRDFPKALLPNRAGTQLRRDGFTGSVNVHGVCENASRH